MSTPHPVETRRPTRWGRLAVAFIMIFGSALTAQYAGANFSDPTTVSQASVGTGTLSLTLGEEVTQPFASTLTFYPGVAIWKVIDITIGSADLKTISVNFDDACGGCSASLLTTDATNGITVGIERCTTAWQVFAFTPPDQIYACADGGGGSFGGTKMLAAQQTPFDTLAGTDVTLSTGLTSFTAAQTYHYMMYFQLPSGTSNGTQGLSAVVRYTFKGTQRDAAAR